MYVISISLTSVSYIFPCKHSATFSQRESQTNCPSDFCASVLQSIYVFSPHTSATDFWPILWKFTWRREHEFFRNISSSFKEDDVIDYYQYRRQRKIVQREYWRHPYIEKNINCRLFIAAEQLNQTVSKFIAFYRISKDHKCPQRF